MDVAVAAAVDMESERWVRYLSPLPGRLRDDPLRDLRAARRGARRVWTKGLDPGRIARARDRAAAEAIDRLQKAIARFDAQR